MRGARGLLSYFVGDPRPQQVHALREIEAAWDSHDVLVVEMPVAAGKSRVAEAVIRWASSGAAGLPGVILANNNMLLDQYLQSGMRGFASLHAKQAYQCREGGSCEARIRRIGGCCRSYSGNKFAHDACPYLRDLAGARSNKKLLVNQHTYLGHKLHRPVLVIDEAHTVLPLLQEAASRRLWRSTYKWPRPLHILDDVRSYFCRPGAPSDEHTELLRAVLDGSVRGYSVSVGEEELRGVSQESVRLTAIDVRDMPPLLWPSSVQRVVLLSATINRLDVESLGLSGRRVKYITTDSPIPVANRPFIHYPVADLTWRARQSGSAEAVAGFLVDEMLPQHEGQRGLIHASYGMASELREMLAGHPRLVFHDRWNKRDVVANWLAGGYGDEAVLVGSGMHEGLDLAGDLARFQVLTNPPRPSIDDPGMAWLADTHPDQYEWLAVRELAQAYGRICRNPDDYGTTVCIDSSTARELQSPQLPQWLREAIQHQ